MRKGLSAKVLVPLILTTLIPGLAFIVLTRWMTEEVLVDYFRQRAIEMARHINEEFYHYYFNKWYVAEGEAFDPLAPDHLKELDLLVSHNMRLFHLERINFFDMRGQVLYSTRKELIGRSAPALPELQRAFKGEVVSQVAYRHRKSLVRRPLHPSLQSDVIEIYIPMICLNPRLPAYRQQVGVIEIYQDIDVIRHWISRIQSSLGGMMVTLLALVIGSAFSALRRSAIRPLWRMMDRIESSAVMVDGRLVMNPIEGEPTYELKSLADSFNRMAQNVIEKSRELEQTIQERTAALRELEEANRELEAFTYSISHDLRAPVLSISGFSRILLEEYSPQLPEEAHYYMQRVRDNAQEMDQLINGLLTFSRLGHQALRMQTIAPAELVRQVLQELPREPAGRSVEIVLGDLPTCEADLTLLKQVFVNLLSNALKFTRGREEARVEVGCRYEGDERVYFVRDNGVGFDMGYADKLFGVFQRLHCSEEYEGTGVGLAIVKRIIQRHGGRIWAEAEMNRGATFYFTLEGGTSHG